MEEHSFKFIKKTIPTNLIELLTKYDLKRLNNENLIDPAVCKLWPIHYEVKNFISNAAIEYSDTFNFVVDGLIFIEEAYYRNQKKSELDTIQKVDENKLHWFLFLDIPYDIEKEKQFALENKIDLSINLQANKVENEITQPVKSIELDESFKNTLLVCDGSLQIKLNPFFTSDYGRKYMYGSLFVIFQFLVP